jgi:hypothetical protein
MKTRTLRPRKKIQESNAPLQSQQTVIKEESMLSKLITILSLIVAIVACYAAYKQAIAADIQADAAKEQVIAAKEQATAAKEQTTAAQQQAVASNDQVIYAKQQAIASDIQASMSSLQSQIAKNEYDASLPNLSLSINDYNDSSSFIIPIDKQTDDLTTRVKSQKYRLVIDLKMSNLSSMPISITNMFVNFQGTEEYSFKSVSKAENYSVTETSLIRIGDKEYPDVFVLQPYESAARYAIFPTDYEPVKEITLANLTVYTSRGNFSLPFKIHSLPGKVSKSPIQFKFDKNRSNENSIPRLVPVY